MDEKVIAAMARWPDVPDVFGWLSLNARGQWRLHPGGNACDHTDPDGPLSAGEAISSSQINQFINRNYTSDDRGRWYFQNGPQRVFVRLDRAPFILHTINSGDGPPSFMTHNGLRAGAVRHWYLDDQGYLFADTDLGAGLVAGRDLDRVLEVLVTADGHGILDALEQSQPGHSVSVAVRDSNGPAVMFSVCRPDHIPDLLKYVRFPCPET